MILRNDASVRLREIRPDDEPRLMALCHRLSPRTVYERFLSFRQLLPEEAHAFANVPEEGATADIGLVVADGWQGLGLGARILEEILRAPEQRGIHRLSADVLTENRRALRLLARHTAITRRMAGSGVTSVVFGRRAGSSLECDITDEQQALVARASSTCMTLRGEQGHGC